MGVLRGTLKTINSFNSVNKGLCILYQLTL